MSIDLSMKAGRAEVKGLEHAELTCETSDLRYSSSGPDPELEEEGVEVADMVLGGTTIR